MIARFLKMGVLTQSAGETVAVNYDGRISGEVTSPVPLAPEHRNPVELRTWCAAVVVVAICVYATLLVLSVMLPSAGIVPLEVMTSAGRSVTMALSVIAPWFFRIIKSALFISFSLFVFAIKSYLYFVFGSILFFLSLLFLLGR